ncbi:MAG TPA: glycosyltransferase family 9 protein [Cyclobacteriaceae bacterium]|nr:glycosyltransferase family 9 protein [Cyclobacteriaceae bacterium]
MKILIIRFSSIGDIVLTTPVIRTVKTQLETEVHFASKIQFSPILKTNPYIDRLHFLDGSLSVLIRELRKEKFDYVIDLHNNLRTRIIKIALGVKAYSVNKLNIEKWLMVNFKINVLPPKHIVDRYLETAARLGVKNDALGLDYFIPPEDEVSLDRLPETHRNGYVAYAIGAQHGTKKLPLVRMIELCEKINRPIVLLGGKEDAEAGEQVKNYFENNDRSAGQPNGKTVIYNACGIYPLNQSASILKKALYVFSHDTGLMHMAAAFKKEIFSIWGNTLPAFGMYPYRTRYTVLENNTISCRPCSKIGFDKCPKGHFKCMNEIKFDFYLPS